jgi:AcrR family transcriptional regulator
MAVIQARPQSDSGERRDEVVKATWRVIAREGLDKASMRAIAQELGTSTGVLTHYFRDKDQMLEFVLSSMAESLEAARVPLMNGAISVEQVLDVLARVLPGTPLRVDWWKVWISFTVAAFSRKRQSLDHATLFSETRKFWTGILRRLQKNGHIRADLNPELEATTLLCLFDGLGVHTVIDPKELSAKRQRSILENYFEKLVR